MRCVTARRLLLDKREARPPTRSRESLAEHLRRCPECRRELAEQNLLAEILAQWPDIEVSEEERRAVVEELVQAAGAGSAERPVGRGMARPTRLRLSFVLAAVALLLLAWTGDRFWAIRPSYTLVTRALDRVPSWYARGAIYPAIFPSGKSGVNNVEVWFRKPDTIRANIDGDYIQFLQRGGERQLYFAPFKLLEIREANSVDLTRIFDVHEWLQRQAVAGVVPARLVGHVRQGRNESKLLFELDLSRVLSADPAGEAILALVRVDRDTMLPERVDTRYLGRDFWLEFDYSREFPPGAEHLNLPEEGVIVGDEIVREVVAEEP